MVNKDETGNIFVDATLYTAIQTLRNTLRTPNMWPENMLKESHAKINELDKLLVDFVEGNL